MVDNSAGASTESAGTEETVASTEVCLTGYDCLRRFLETDTMINALLKIHSDPENIKFSAHYALDQVIEEVMPEWKRNRSEAMGQY